MAYCKIEAPYPTPAEGQKRVVFALDPLANGEDEQPQSRLQLIPGRTITMSRSAACSAASFEGTVEECTVDGWGFDYYNVMLSDEMTSAGAASTSDDGEEQVRKFVPISRPEFIRYNSEAPVVVYLPEDAELRYSVWTGGEEEIAQKG